VYVAGDMLDFTLTCLDYLWIMNLIEEKTDAINSLCEKHKVKRLYAFGSILSSSFNEESDVDFLVDFNKNQIENFGANFFEFLFSLEDLFCRKIDLIERDAIRNPYFKEDVEETKLLIYGPEN
jgi:predicted nucleotidyltransferase